MRVFVFCGFFDCFFLFLYIGALLHFSSVNLPVPVTPVVFVYGLPLRSASCILLMSSCCCTGFFLALVRVSLRLPPFSSSLSSALRGVDVVADVLNERPAVLDACSRDCKGF